MILIKDHKGMYATVSDLAQYMSLSTDTVRRIVEEMKEYRSRYNFGVVKTGNILRVNVLAFIDYCTYREDFKNDRLVPPYDAQLVRENLGMNYQLRRVN